MTPNEVKKAFKQGDLSKQAFILQMFEHHRSLYDYQECLNGTDIAEITIQQEAIIFTLRETGLKFAVSQPDQRIAPFEIINFNAYEPDESALILSLLKAGDVVLDIGANIGWYSLLMQHHVPDLEIHAFEPMPPVYAALNKNIDLNQAIIKSYPVALSDHTGTTQFYYDPEFSSRSSQANLADKPVAQLSVDLKTLDEFILEEEIQSVSFIKIDVEGAELMALKGGLKTIAEHRPIIFAEMLRKWSAKFDYHPNEIIRLLSPLEYQCHAVTPTGIQAIAEVDENTTATNFVFLNTQIHQDVIQELGQL